MSEERGYENGYLSPLYDDAFFFIYRIYKVLISCGNICQRALSLKGKRGRRYKQTMFTDINVKRRIPL